MRAWVQIPLLTATFLHCIDLTGWGLKLAWTQSLSWNVNMKVLGLTLYVIYICWAVSALQCCYFDWVAFLACLLHIWKVAWPSGLRRWFKAPVSSGAWVRIPPLPKTFFPKKGRKTKNFSGDTRIWTMDLSDCSRLLYHWAISPELDCCLHFVWGEEPVCAGVSCCVYEHTGRARRRR